MQMKKVTSVLIATAFLGIGCFIGVNAAELNEKIEATRARDIKIKYNNEYQILYQGAVQTYPIVYEGTTYLPIRSISNILGVPVNWDAQNRTVLLGNNNSVLNNSTNNEKNTATKPVVKEELTRREEVSLKLGELFDKGLAFKAGSYVKGDIPKGEYAFIGEGRSKYYCEKEFSGNIIDNENFDSFGYVYVHEVGNIETRGTLVNVKAFDELEVSGAKQLYEILNEQKDYMQSGMYKVGSDIPAGTYTVESIGRGYFSVLSGPVGNNEIINNDNFNGRQKVTLKNRQYLELSGATISK